MVEEVSLQPFLVKHAKVTLFSIVEVVKRCESMPVSKRYSRNHTETN